MQNQLPSKPHYLILDALRGVAAIMVVLFHIVETHGNPAMDPSPDKFNQLINHGYLAVDFFFLLSGFVIGYAYDDRWNKMSLSEFFKRRLIRLQPMVVMGMLVGAALFYFQDSTVAMPIVHTIPVWQMLLILLIGITLIPVPPSMDIRGWQEMHPLDGPAWSLFFEYVGNLFYAILVRRFPNWLLALLVAVSAAFLVHYTVWGDTGDLIGGWSLEPQQFKIGFTRLMFPFFGGLLLSRMIKIKSLGNTFIWCSLLLLLVLNMPRFGDAASLWKNGLYESVAVILLFPLIVFLGASGKVSGSMEKVCKFLGDISYPIYITHYPIIYIYTAWVFDNKKHLNEAYPYSILVLVSSVLLAWASLKLYDEPVRKWLTKKFM